MLLISELLARLRREQGQTFVEYALILAFIAILVLWGGLGDAIQAAIDAVTDAINGA